MANVPVKQKENSLGSPKHPSAGNSPALSEYYKSASGKFRAAKFVTVLLLIVFLILSFTFLRKDITLENLRYLLKFISFTNTETSITAAKINYASGDPNRLELYMGDLCTLSPSGYALYDSRGNQIMSEPINYVSPILKVSSRYTLCYDMDGYSFAVLNSFSKLYDETIDYPITAGAVSNKGFFAIAAASREYRTAITVYNDDFSAVTRIYKNDHLMSMEFSPDGSELAVVTAGVFNGEFKTKIELVSPSSDEIFASCEIAGLGYNFYFTDNGYAAVTDEGINFFDKGLNPTKKVYHDTQLVMTDCSGKYLTAVYSDSILGNNSLVDIYSAEGKIVYQGEFEDKLIAVASDDSGDYVFLLAGKTLSRINLLNKKLGEISVVSDAIDMLVQNESSVLIALRNYALTYELTDFDEQYYDRPVSDSTDDTASSDTTKDTLTKNN